MKIRYIRLPALMVKGGMLPASLKARPQKEGKADLFSFFPPENHFLMMGIHSLVRVPVHIQQGFKSAVISAAGFPEIK